MVWAVGDSGGLRQRIDLRAAVVLDQAPGLALLVREVHCCCLEGETGWAAMAILIGSPSPTAPPSSHRSWGAWTTLASLPQRRLIARQPSFLGTNCVMNHFLFALYEYRCRTLPARTFVVVVASRNILLFPPTPGW